MIKKSLTLHSGIVKDSLFLPQLSYFKNKDILHLSLSEEPKTDNIEVIGASAFLRNSILESAQANY